ncbi:hypothetical protein JYU34_001813 [Plutella xylostella]|uniref:Uncharacterized protein n=1 Tax=Plutella xylostella TaxID=51655 RepID=A0ABQ7R4Y8_PLUXY|nr:hypothetical protein JYU34_001813 [Plutella xylostella]
MGAVGGTPEPQVKGELRTYLYVGCGYGNRVVSPPNIFCLPDSINAFPHVASDDTIISHSVGQYRDALDEGVRRMVS